MNWLVVAAGLAGLAAVLIGFAELTHAAFRERDVRYVLAALGVAVVTVIFLVVFGDRLLQ